MYTEYSVHTFELQTQIDYNTIHSLNNTFFNKSAYSIEKKTKLHKKKLCSCSYTFRQLNLPRINSITLKGIDLASGIPRYYVNVKINLQTAISSFNTAHIIHPDKIEEAMSKVHRNLTLLLPSEIIESLHFKRIDFCMNMIFDSPEQVPLYMKLLKKGITPASLQEYKFISPTQHRMITYKESFLLKCKTYSFQIYDKHKQMINRNLQNSDTAIGMIRFELRANRNKIISLCDKYNILYPDYNKMKFLKQIPQITKCEVEKLCTTMYGTGDFHNYTYVKNKILNSEYRQNTIDDMLIVLKYIAHHSSCQNIYENLHMKSNKFKRLMEKFNAIKCSPITIPASYNIPYLPLPF